MTLGEEGSSFCVCVMCILIFNSTNSVHVSVFSTSLPAFVPCIFEMICHVFKFSSSVDLMKIKIFSLLAICMAFLKNVDLSPFSITDLALLLNYMSWWFWILPSYQN